VIHAAGAVLWRPRSGGQVEVAVVHRPHHRDWSLPKGKVDPGESDEHAALREVEEETGVRPRLGPELGVARYRDGRGRPKQVRYWLMEPADPDERPKFQPNHEIDELRWCSAADTGKLLSYEHDRKLITEAEALA
jgi:8-oxo-dGTP pyrophosphatase MutT (NUDIX family)